MARWRPSTPFFSPLDSSPLAAYAGLADDAESFVSGFSRPPAPRAFPCPRPGPTRPHIFPPAAVCGGCNIMYLSLDRGVSVSTCTRRPASWIRYPPPRWSWRGTAICGVPAKCRARCPARLAPNNRIAPTAIPTLALSCTQHASTARTGRGLHCEYDHALDIDARLVFARPSAPISIPQPPRSSLPVCPAGRSLAEKKPIGITR